MSEPLTVLVVEDHADTRTVLQTLLRADEYVVKTSSFSDVRRVIRQLIGGAGRR